MQISFWFVYIGFSVLIIQKKLHILANIFLVAIMLAWQDFNKCAILLLSLCSQYLRVLVQD
jgi:hypothetical protein